MAKEITTVSHNALAFGTTVKGEIITENDIRIDGKVEGNIECKGKVVVGSSGVVQGNIVCASAEIIGSQVGNLKAHDTLTIQASGKVTGDIDIRILIVEPNAIFQGKCTMKDE